VGRGGGLPRLCGCFRLSLASAPSPLWLQGTGVPSRPVATTRPARPMNTALTTSACAGEGRSRELACEGPLRARGRLGRSADATERCTRASASPTPAASTWRRSAGATPPSPTGLRAERIIATRTRATARSISVTCSSRRPTTSAALCRRAACRTEVPRPLATASRRARPAAPFAGRCRRGGSPLFT
jgi:hypothetical protein